MILLLKAHSLHPLPPFLLGGMNFLPNLPKGRGLTGPQFLDLGCWESGGGGELFQGGLQFLHKK